MAGTVVDSLVSAAGATAEVGNDGLPTSGQKGGTLRVGIGSEQPSNTTFSGAKGKMDAAAFCIANAVYDPLFVASADGKTWLPNLAINATSDAAAKVWTITLRQGVTFHNGDAFTADHVVANYTAAKNDLTVGLAIKPLIANCEKVSTYVVKYTTVNSWTTFPFHLSEQQIAYMAHPIDLDANGGKPIGTGPFLLQSLGDWNQTTGVSTWQANPNYWKKDSAGNSLPYVDTLVFKVIVDPNSRWQALQSGTIDLMVNQDGGTIKNVKTATGSSVTAVSGSNSSYRWVSDENGVREPAINCLIVNTQGAPANWPAGGKPKGAVNPSNGTWNATATPVVSDIRIRQACAAAINRTTYLSGQDGSIGQVIDGIYRAKVGGKANPMYKDPKYPKYSTTAAKALVAAWKKANPGVACAFVIDIVAGNDAQLAAFTWIKGQLNIVGITVTSRSMVQKDLIQAKIDKHYDASTWSQFGGITPDLNYVWFNSFPFFGKQASNYVNFAQQADPALQAAMIAGMKAANGSAAQKTAWQTVNTRLAANIPYLYLDTTVTQFVARANVKNFAYAGTPGTMGSSANKATARAYSPDGGSARWEHIFKV